MKEKGNLRKLWVLIAIVILVIIAFATVKLVMYYKPFFKEYNIHTAKVSASSLENVALNYEDLNIKLLEVLNQNSEEKEFGTDLAKIEFSTTNGKNTSELHCGYIIYDNNKNILAIKYNKTFLDKYFVKKEYDSFDLSKINHISGSSSFNVDGVLDVNSNKKTYTISSKIDNNYKNEIAYPLHIQIFELNYKEIDGNHNTVQKSYNNDVFEFLVNE